METKVGKEELLALGGELIREGFPVAFPTETVYGLGGDAYNEKAVEAIFNAKGRPQDNPLIVHISSPKELEGVAVDVPKAAYKLFEVFSPGPLTLVLKKSPLIPKRTTGGLDTVGVRIPDHPLALGLIKAAARPIAAPSANVSGRVSPTEASHVLEDMKGKIPLILDGGKTRVGIESTVLDLTKDIPVILRPGAVTAGMLAPVLGAVKVFSGEVVVAEAPGMKYKHYSPVCPCVGVNGPQTARAEYEKREGEGLNPVLVASDNLIEKSGIKNAISLGNSPEAAMANLFSALRKAEKKFGYILLEWFEGADYYPVQNRIKKATGGAVIR
ncbi:MAG: threonylcarbamoyl-AMP synthase [Clostridiales bacterium]|jgi:L-threonylcarbamoyladenylate synthase|nr:threonylcarbamoyl-AMP synthase [Clostridiales bacterium]HOB64774.1 L-threonylcarbamoyladenylate synthase [Clostridia bacterium]HOK81359.1 L-threonylcarbamoyladenylate synthase [Clostridia bacterium]HOL60658.1 L-threonylcarbamoyladenylate synthase [Clostridia bacterium]HPO53235.1 L-threonylcarbamoyladenylate synthase [Clostridia bacterium]